MSVKTIVNSIYKKVWEDHHVTPEEFEINRQEKQEEYETWCKDFTDEDRERIKKPCELLSRLFESTDRDESKAIYEEFEAESETLTYHQSKAVEYFRAECLVKQYKDKSCFTSRKTKDWYRLQAERARRKR
jgi:hypothetical protein